MDKSARRKPKKQKNHLKKRFFIFATLALLLVVGSYFSEHLCPYDPYEQNLSIAKASPSLEHMLSRVIVGSKTSIYSTLLLVVGITVIGTIVGIICGWNGKKLDTILMRISDIFLAFPGLVFALAVAAVMGGGVQNAVIALGAISWPKYARIARSQTLAQKESLYMRAAILSGCSTGKLILKHILPNITGPILVTAMLDMGSMMSDTRNLLTTHPWVTFAPGIAIFLSVMVFNLLGDTVRDLLDPRNER